MLAPRRVPDAILAEDILAFARRQLAMEAHEKVEQGRALGNIVLAMP